MQGVNFAFTRRAVRGSLMMRVYSYCVYILASERNGTLYIGVTRDLKWRVHQHREGLLPGFTKRYGVTMLVYFENHVDITGAIAREKRLKRWQRSWKLALIEQSNPQWLDLWPEIAEWGPV
jgi:putative endonuclease